MRTVIFPALRHRNLRIFLWGQGISLVGTWIQHVALSWLVYRLTNSAFLLGIVGFGTQMPTLVLAPVAGMLADRWDRRRILLWTQGLAMLHVLILWLLVLTGMVAVWQLIVIGILLGVINALDIPARQSFIVDTIDSREDVGSAIALQSSVMNAARLVGSSVAGPLVAIAGEGLCFLLNGLSYLAVIAALVALRIAPRPQMAPSGPVRAGLEEGFRLAFGVRPVRSILLLVGLVTLLGRSYAVLLPIFAADVFLGGPETLGFLVAASGLGALGGTLYLSARTEAAGFERRIALASAVSGAALILFAVSPFLSASLALMLVTGFGTMVHLASSNAAIQTAVDDAMRGRVMSFYTAALVGLAPIGSVVTGALASIIGAPNAVLIGGVACVIGSLAFRTQWRTSQREVE